MEWTEDQIQRYSRNILLPEVGAVGQERIAAARVLVVGAGGLGSPSLLYLAAAGVGTLGIADDDTVDLTNLQRQVAHTTDRIGALKAPSAAETIAALNPEVRVVTHTERVTADGVEALIADYDLVLDGSDNFATRYLLNDACRFAGKPLVSAAILRFDGQLTVYAPDGPCLRCLFPTIPEAGAVPSCAEAGILGAVAGIMGSWQAAEALKLIVGMGEPLIGRLLVMDALGATVRTVKVPRDPRCALCGDSPTIPDLSHHRTGG